MAIFSREAFNEALNLKKGYAEPVLEQKIAEAALKLADLRDRGLMLLVEIRQLKTNAGN